MLMSVTITLNGFFNETGTRNNCREKKGESLMSFPNDYVVLDLETTGLSPKVDEIIEIGAIKVQDGQIVEQFQTLCKPCCEIDEFIEETTGITNAMLNNAPNISDILENLMSFLGENIIVGHNVNFDINFIYDTMMKHKNVPFENDFVDTMRIARRALPELPHHRLSDLVEHYGIKQDTAHRALADCICTFECFEKMKEDIAKDDGICLKQQVKTTKKQSAKNVSDLSKLTTENETFDCSHPLYNRYCVFTGELKRYSRAAAAQIVVDYGGFCQNNVTKKTNYVILGGYEGNRNLKGNKSSKHKKAEELKLKGQDIEVVPEDAFYDMLEM